VGATPEPLRPLRTVLVTTDLSPLGDAAVPEAYRLLLRGGGEVILFHAADPGLTGLDPDRRTQIEAALRAPIPEGIDGHLIRTRTSVAADHSGGDAIPSWPAWNLRIRTGVKDHRAGSRYTAA